MLITKHMKQAMLKCVLVTDCSDSAQGLNRNGQVGTLEIPAQSLVIFCTIICMLETWWLENSSVLVEKVIRKLLPSVCGLSCM